MGLMNFTLRNGKVVQVSSQQHRSLMRVVYPAKYEEETKEKIDREKDRLRKYFTKEELTNEVKFAKALQEKFAKKDRRGVDTGMPLRFREKTMWNKLKMKDDIPLIERWIYPKRQQQWEVSVKRANNGRFMAVQKIKMLVQEETGAGQSVERQSAYSV